ncbi:MAG: cell wall-binding repeat-containing protein, partial [bacterium]|nr:cell wall-binding repeat-containing protein [bacterium]
DAVINYFKGSADEWRTGVLTASEISYSNLWDGIDLVVSSTAADLKYEFVVAPGADPSVINMRYQGADLRLDQGALIAKTPGATYVDQAPSAYQGSINAQEVVPVEFTLQDANTVTFATGEYDHSVPLVIDPIVVTYASYLGGTDEDDNGEIQIDGAGNIYTGGRSFSADMFTGAPGFDTTYGGGGLYDGYVVKYAPDGASLIWGTYIGGTMDDSLFGMTIDAAGDVYVTGTTHSRSSFQVPDEGFPATAGAYDTTYNGTTEQDAYVCKIDTDGLSLHYCTYLGGSDSDHAFDIAVDSLGRAYIAGMTLSSTAEGFPTLTGPDLTFNGTAAAGDHDAFVARFSADGSALSYSGYIGGDGGVAAVFRTESGEGIVVDDAFNAYVTGTTTSSHTSFPDGDGFGGIPGGTIDQTYNGAGDGFIVKVDPTGASFLGATYIGGAATDKLYTNHLTPAGELLILGDTTSTEATGFPVAGGFDATQNGALDTVVVRVDATITALLQSGFYGGSGDDFAGESCKSIVMDSDNNIYITGWTDSTEASFPVLDGPDLTYNGDVYDGFIAKFTDGGTPVYSGYLGGEGDDYACGIALDSTGGAWTTVTTPSSVTFPNGFGFYSIPGLDQTFNGAYDGSIIRVSEVPAGVTVVESDGSTDIDEIGPTSDAYTVVLESQPQFDVTVTIAPNAQQTTDQASITFTPLDWDVPQPVQVTAVQDGNPECPHTGLIVHTAESADLNYDGIATASVVPNITDQCTIIPGEDPQQQSIGVSKHRFPADHSAPAAILARDDIMADAFTGVPFASVRPAPLLLTDSTSINQDLVDELNRVLTTQAAPIYILGREQAVTQTVYDQLAAEGFTNVQQVGGVNRRETAAIIANTIVAQQGTVNRVFVTEDEALVDALGAGAAAGLLGADTLVDPILLNARGSNQIDEHTHAFINAHSSIRSVELIGGHTALDASLDATFTSRYPSLVSVARTGGLDRFATNALIASKFFAGPTGIVVANGQRDQIPGALAALSTGSANFFAALLAGTVASDEGWPLLLVTNYSLPAPIRQYIVDYAATIDGLIVVGDPAQVSSDVIDQILSIM